MSNRAREQRLLTTFVELLEDHKKDFEGFVRDIENVRFCHTPVDAQQLNRCEYALRNMDIRLLTLKNCIESGATGDLRDQLVKTKNEWVHLRGRVNEHLHSIHLIIEETTRSLQPMRRTLDQ